MDDKRGWLIKGGLAAVVALVAALGGAALYGHRHYAVPVVLGPGVTRVARLSDYCPSLKGTAADAHVYFLDGQEPGGKALVLGSSHANEPAGMLASLVLVENARVERGGLVVIPFFNRSASLYTRPGDGYVLFFDIPTPWGSKRLRMGNREASPLDQWPDPDVYIHYPEGQMLSFADARNVNRAWPGRPDGNLMERVTYAAMQLMRQEGVDVALDLHGAETMFPVTNCIVAPEKATRIAVMASLTVKAREGFDNHVEPSPSSFRGLSHREIGDYSDVLPFLLEAPIPYLDQPTGPKTEELMLTGKDPFLLALAARKRLFVPYDEAGWPMDRRVGQHLSVSLEILDQFSRRTPGQEIVVTGVPRYAEVVAAGVGQYLHDPAAAPSQRVVYE